MHTGTYYEISDNFWDDGKAFTHKMNLSKLFYGKNDNDISFVFPVKNFVKPFDTWHSTLSFKFSRN